MSGFNVKFPQKTIKNRNMQVIDYIDWREMYNDIKKKHLEQYPTAKEYIEEVKTWDEPYDYIEEMYRMFEEDFSEMDVFSSDNYDDYSFQDILKEGKIHVEFSEGGNNATENGDDYWGYGLCFTINLDEELFVGYNYENYS